MLNENIINSGQYLQEIKNLIWDNSVTIISLIASIVTIIVAINGLISLRILAKVKNWKDRKAIRYSILNPIKQLVYSEVVFYGFIIEFIQIILSVVIPLIVIYSCLYLININLSDKNMDAYFGIVFCILACISCDLIYKRENKNNYIVLVILYLIFADILIMKITLNSFIPDNAKGILNFLTFVCVSNFISIECILDQISINRENRKKSSKILKWVRVFFGSVYIALCFHNAIGEELTNVEMWVTVFYFLVWLILCHIETIINNNIKVDFRINNEHGFDITQKSIYQYEYDKVKYILSDGCIKIVDSEEIQSIDYIVENIMGWCKKKKVTCLLKNNDILYFDGYKFIKDLWVSFYKLNGNKKNVKIINSEKVKKIIVEEIK